MAGVNVKMSVDSSSFTSGLKEARESVKTLDEELKLNEKQLKAVGDAEIYASNKSKLLNEQMEAQKKVVAGIQGQLQEMKDRGVDEASTAYQKLERSLYSATGKMMDIQAEINNLATNEKDAAKEADNLDTNVRKIGKGVALQNLASGLKDITDKLESGAKAAINFGKKVARSAMDSTEWADDILTRSLQYGIDAETLQRMENAAAYIDTDVDTILAAKTRLGKNKDNLVELLGVDANGRTIDEVFWDAGAAIMAMTDEFEREEAAQKVFGRGWKELVPLFTAGQEEYEEMLATQNVLTNEQVEKLGEADDQFKQIQQEIALLKNQFWAENSDTIIELLQWVIDNKDAVVIALGAIGTAFAALKVGQLAIDIRKVVTGFKDIMHLGGAGAGAGASGGAAAAGGGSATGGAAATGGGAAAKTSLGAWLLDGLGISGWGAIGGAGISAAIVYAGGKYIASLNDAANEARRVSTDIHRLDNVFGDQQINDIPRELSNAMNGVMKDKRLVLQETVRALLGMEAGSGGAINTLKYLGANIGGNMLDTFNYGEGKNKLMDMLLMSGDATPAAAAMLLNYGGVSYNDILSMYGGQYANAFSTGLEMFRQNGESWSKSGGFTEAIGVLQDYFMKSGTYDENGQWSIPSLLEEEAAKSSEAAEAMNAAAETMAGLPEATAAAVSGAVAGIKLSVNLGDLFKSHANGIWSVPWDGYPAILHRGERVMTASEAQRYTTNNYFGTVNLNNGLEIEQLTESIDRRNKRQMAGFGAA